MQLVPDVHAIPNHIACDRYVQFPLLQPLLPYLLASFIASLLRFMITSQKHMYVCLCPPVHSASESEVVIPLYNESKQFLGVLDMDSPVRQNDHASGEVGFGEVGNIWEP